MITLYISIALISFILTYSAFIIPIKLIKAKNRKEMLVNYNASIALCKRYNLDQTKTHSLYKKYLALNETF